MMNTEDVTNRLDAMYADRRAQCLKTMQKFASGGYERLHEYCPDRNERDLNDLLDIGLLVVRQNNLDTNPVLRQKYPFVIGVADEPTEADLMRGKLEHARPNVSASAMEAFEERAIAAAAEAGRLRLQREIDAQIERRHHGYFVPTA
jgi:hypothetical protein